MNEIKIFWEKELIFCSFVSPLAASPCFHPLYKSYIQTVKNSNNVKELKIKTLLYTENNQITDVLTFDGSLWMCVFMMRNNISIFIKF